MWPDVQGFSIAQLTFYCSVNGQRIINTFGYQCGGVANPKPADSVTQAFFASLAYIDLEGDYRACFAGDYTLNEAWFQILFPARIRKSVFERNLAGTGDGVTNRQNTQACISRHGVTADRKNNGGIHLVIPETDAAPNLYVDAGLLLPAYKATLQNLANSMKSAINTVVDGQAYNWAPVIINPDPVTHIPNSASLIVETNVQDECRTMRRRTVGRGI